MVKLRISSIAGVTALVFGSLAVTPGIVQASRTPRTARTVNLGGKYGHYRRYEKKLPAKVRGTWYTLSNRKHHYYDQLKFSSYRKIVETLRHSSINSDNYNLIGKQVYGSKLFYNGHWFMIMGIAQGPSLYVKTMRLAGKKRSVLIRYEQGQTTYYLRSKIAHYYKFANKTAPGWKLSGGY